MAVEGVGKDGTVGVEGHARLVPSDPKGGRDSGSILGREGKRDGFIDEIIPLFRVIAKEVKGLLGIIVQVMLDIVNQGVGSQIGRRGGRGEGVEVGGKSGCLFGV